MEDSNVIHPARKHGELVGYLVTEGRTWRPLGYVKVNEWYPARSAIRTARMIARNPSYADKTPHNCPVHRAENPGTWFWELELMPEGEFQPEIVATKVEAVAAE